MSLGNTSNRSYNCNVLWIPAGSDYGGITNEDGLVPGGTQCTDPGDGTGTYSYAEHGPQALSICNQACSGVDLNPNALGIGCLYHWDPNYCTNCTSSYCTSLDFPCTDGYWVSISRVCCFESELGMRGGRIKCSFIIIT